MDMLCLNSYLIYMVDRSEKLTNSPCECIKHKCYCNERGKGEDKEIQLSLSTKETDQCTKQ